MTSLELRQKHIDQLKKLHPFEERIASACNLGSYCDSHYSNEKYIEEKIQYLLNDFKRYLLKNNQKQKDYYKVISVIQLKPKDKLYDILCITKRRKVNLKQIQNVVLDYFNTHKTYHSTLISLECIKIK